MADIGSSREVFSVGPGADILRGGFGSLLHPEDPFTADEECRKLTVQFFRGATEPLPRRLDLEQR
jgi:hypothetical protein